jgi:hypothetical protein
VILLLFLLAADAKDCTIGKPCGDTCIEQSDTCHLSEAAVQDRFEGAARLAGTTPAFVNSVEALLAERARQNLGAWADDRSRVYAFAERAREAEEAAKRADLNRSIEVYFEALKLPRPLEYAVLEDDVQRFSARHSLARVLRDTGHNASAKRLYGDAIASGIFLRDDAPLNTSQRQLVEGTMRRIASEVDSKGYPLFEANGCPVRLFQGGRSHHVGRIARGETMRVFSTDGKWRWGIALDENGRARLHGWVDGECLSAL